MTPLLTLSQASNVPVYVRIADAICCALVSGDYQPGDRLPTETKLARDLNVSALTASRAYATLRSQRIVTQRRGSGTYIASDVQRRLRPKAHRSISRVLVVLGVPTLSRVRRERLFLITDVLDGARETFKSGTNFEYIKNLTSASLGSLDAEDAVMIIGFGRHDPEALQALHDNDTPVVGVWNDVSHVGLGRVGYDRTGAVRQACQHLIDGGHRRIGFLGNPLSNDSTLNEKSHAFTTALQDAGLDVLSRDIARAYVDPGQAYTAMADMIKRNDLPDALFIDTDYKAMEAIAALKAAGIRVPEDISVVSYDDVPEAAMHEPALTTMRVPRREIGIHGAQVLLNWGIPSAWPSNILLPAQLIVRQSTRVLKS